MENKQKFKFILFILCLFCSLNLTGCNLLDDDDDKTNDQTIVVVPIPDNSNSNAVVDKNTPSFKIPETEIKLASIREPVESESTDNMSVKLPDLAAEAKYSVVVSNLSGQQQTIRIQYEEDPTQINASVKNQEEENFYIPMSLMASNGFSRHYEDPEAKARALQTIKAGIQQSLRNRSRVRTSVRANHTSEMVNDIVPIFRYDDLEYPRNCLLIKITEHGKFFVQEGVYGSSVTYEDIADLADEYETMIYSFMKEYGDVFDVDRDGKLSIVILNLPYGVAGLFNTADLLSPTNGGNGNSRDMISIWTPIKDRPKERWITDTRETIAHEMQHLINYSYKLRGNGITQPEHLEESIVPTIESEHRWIDEGLSVMTEARFRDKRGLAGKYTVESYTGAKTVMDSKMNDSRFGDYLAAEPMKMVMTAEENFGLAGYGQKGLFLVYLNDQLGDQFIYELVRSKDAGFKNLKNLISSYGADFYVLLKNFNTAIQNEYLQLKGLASKDTVTDSKLKFKKDMFPSFITSEQRYTKFNKYIRLGKGSNKTDVPPSSSLRYIITQSADFIGYKGFRVFHSAAEPITVRIEKIQ